LSVAVNLHYFPLFAVYAGNQLAYTFIAPHLFYFFTLTKNNRMKRKFLSLMAIAIAFTAQSQSWNVNGNAGINPGIHFLGTLDSSAFRFRVNNLHAGEISLINSNTSFGFRAGQSQAGMFTVAIGEQSMQSNMGYANSAVGVLSLRYNNNGSWNAALGAQALMMNTTGTYNVAVGARAMIGNNIGVSNVAIGYSALPSGIGSKNTAIGANAFTSLTSSEHNTAIGYSAGYWPNLGWNNTLLGAHTNGSFFGQYNIVAVGQGVVCTDNSVARIGNSATWSIGGFANWTNFSDGRYKKNVQENVKGLDFIMKLRPVTYNLDIAGASKNLKENGGQEWDEQTKEAILQKEKMVYTGFVAQEVEQAASAAGFEFSGVDKPRNEYSFYGLRYSEFVVPLVKAMQEQQETINQLLKRMEDLEKRSGTGFPNKNALSVRPNPSQHTVSVSIVADNESPAHIKIFDSKGALVKMQQANLFQGANQVNIDINTLPNGVYQLAAEWNKGQVKKTARIVKQ
jgi:trimeric autotransporter adhesin